MQASLTTEKRGRGRPSSGDAPDPNRIARVAFAVFAAHGFEGARLREVAALAQVDVALVSRRYGSKLGLWMASVDDLAQRMNNLWDAIATQTSGTGLAQEDFHQALRMFVEFSGEVPELGRFVTNEISTPSFRRDYVYDQIWRPCMRVMNPLMQKAADAGLHCLSSPDFFVFMLIGAISMPLMMRELISQETGVDEAMIGAMLQREIFSLCSGRNC